MARSWSDAVDGVSTRSRTSKPSTVPVIAGKLVIEFTSRTCGNSQSASVNSAVILTILGEKISSPSGALIKSARLSSLTYSSSNWLIAILSGFSSPINTRPSVSSVKSFAPNTNPAKTNTVTAKRTLRYFTKNSATTSEDFFSKPLDDIYTH